MRSTLRRALSTLSVAALATAFFTASPGAGAESADTAYPTLNGVSMTKATVAAGSNLVAAVDATDDVGITSVSVRFVNAGNSLYTATGSGPWRSDGLVSVPTSSNTASGPYALSSVTLLDASGKKSQYLADGHKLVLSPTPATGPTTHSLDLATTTFTVLDGTDVTAPRVTSVSLPTRPSAAMAAGRLDLGVDDSGAVTATAVWQHSTVTGEFASDTRQSSGGLVSLPFSHHLAGTYRLSAIVVKDPAGNVRQYLRNGTVSSVGSTGTHTLDFARFDLALRPSPPTPLVTPHPGSVRVRVAATADEAKTQTGWRVVVNPGNIVRDVPIRTGATHIDVKGLVNGTTYTVATTARSVTGDSAATTRSVHPMPSTNVFAVADATGDKRVDVVARQPRTTTTDGVSYVYPTNGKGAWGSRFSAFHAEEPNCERVAPGDVYVVGQSEVLCYGDGLIALNRDGSGFGLGTRGWSSMRFVDGGYDLTSDGHPDILGVASDGALRLYETRNSTTIRTWKQIGTGWQIYTSVFQPGDMTGDGRNDIAAVDTGGRLWLYAGNGKGGVAPRRQIGSGWGTFGAVLPLRDFNGDGKSDIGAITMDGTLWLYPGNGRSGFLPRKAIGAGWNIFF